MELILEVTGMTCSHCEAAVMCEVGKLAGVDDVHVDLVTKLVTVTGQDLDLQSITTAVDEAGYEVAGHREAP